MSTQFRNTCDRRTRRRHDHQHAARGQRHGPGLLEIADIGSHDRKIGSAGGERFRSIERVAGIFDLEPDRRIRSGEAAGDDGRNLLRFAVRRPHGERQGHRARVEPV